METWQAFDDAMEIHTDFLFFFEVFKFGKGKRQEDDLGLGLGFS